MKVFCDCSAEMFPSEGDDGKPEACLPVATMTVLGKTRYQINAVWYLCPACGKSAAVIPDYPRTEDTKDPEETEYAQA